MRKRNSFYFESILLALLTVAAGSQPVAGQSVTDTVFQINDVLVSASRHRHFRNDIKTLVFSGDDLKPFTGASLGQFLMNKTALNIKAYGAGGAASTISLRGTTPGHVQVNWNGLPINSVSLGSADFSMIPAGGFNSISVVYGAPGAVYGSGTFGGAINLESDLAPGKALNGTAQVSYNSLETITGSASFHIGNDKLAWKINTWASGSENEFTYYDYIRQSYRDQTDGAWRDAGIIQHAILQLGSSTIEAGMWYQFKNYNIPSRIGSTSYEVQRDSSLKFFAEYNKKAYRWGLKIKAALFNDEQAYFQKAAAQSSEYSIESRIKATQAYGDANFRYYMKPHLSVDAGLIVTHITADLSAYGEQKDEEGLTAFAGLRYDRNRLSWQTQLRREWNSHFHSGMLPSFGLAWKALPEKWTLRANISKKFRKPTFNDLYWIPGGNTGLEPEKGYSLEGGSELRVWEQNNIQVTADLGFYLLEIEDMIAWQPAEAYWKAVNYQHVTSTGIDANLLADIEGEKWKYHSSLMLSLNRSLAKTSDGNEDVLLLYSPPVSFSWENKFSVGIFDINAWYHFTSGRYYDDNSMLDPYHIFKVQAGLKIPLWQGELGLHVSVNNLTNNTYELIRLYPMPGRYWSLKTNYTF